jgi:hypothetical protein
LNFSVTDYIYARDNGSVSGNTSNGDEGFEAGNLFDIFQDQELKAINVRLAGGGSGTTVGTEIYAKIYEIDPQTGDFVYLAESDPFIVASNNLNNNLVMELQTPVLLSANSTYLAVVGSYTSGLKVTNAGTSEPLTSFFYDWANTTWYYQTSTPYVRLNFDPSISIEEKPEVNFTIFPNPAQESVMVIIENGFAGSIKYSIKDISGKEISSGSFIDEISISEYKSGIYFFELISENGIFVKQFVKK